MTSLAHCLAAGGSRITFVPELATARYAMGDGCTKIESKGVTSDIRHVNKSKHRRSAAEVGRVYR
eukprot:5780346-Amphidinium_carterae.1